MAEVKPRKMFCCGCKQAVKARLTNGAEIYPGNRWLASRPFWKCDTCGNYVGTHHKTKDRIRPLGDIPTAELRQARMRIHSILDRMWRTKIERALIYGKLTRLLGYSYHTGNIVSIEEANRVEACLKELNQLQGRETIGVTMHDYTCPNCGEWMDPYDKCGHCEHDERFYKTCECEHCAAASLALAQLAGRIAK